ncbi:MAG TPA: hypothetical protein VF344_03980 [Candidatus Limnocylindrales bacterium]
MSLGLVGFLVAACTASTATPGTSLSAPLPSVPSTTAAPDPSASAAFPQPTDTAVQSHAPVTLASLGPVPTGRWTSIHWTQAMAPPVLAQAQASPGEFGRVWSVFGWSHGYVAFAVRDASNGAAVTEIYTFSSPDGLNWTSGTRLTYPDFVGISGVVEGPAGLLAAAKFVPGTCGGAPSVALVWRSTDGITWRQAAVFSVAAGDIEGGPAGYVAIGNAGEGTNPAWISFDGANWKHVDMTAPAFKGVDGIESGAVFSGGFVLAGATLGAAIGCGGYLNPLTGSLWWSADAKTWSRDVLSGTTTAAQVSTSVRRLSDTALLATESSSDGIGGPTATSSWTSTDGRTWKSISIPASIDIARALIVTNGRRGLVLSNSTDETKPAPILAFQDDLTLTELAQTGDIPDSTVMQSWAYQRFALGPTGIVVMSSDGSSWWVGVPVAG